VTLAEAVTHGRRGATRRRRGRENSPSRPTIWGMTVVDRPTTSEQFFGRFHAHGFPDRWECQASTYTSAPSPGAPLDRRGRWVFLIIVAGGRRDMNLHPDSAQQEPRYGTWTAVTPAAILKSSPAT
jgi:hypothetical protein